MKYSIFFQSWPWMGLGFAVVLLIFAFGTNALRSDTSKSRWKDPTWIAWLGAIAYMLHNFEEYGVAFDGVTLSFAKYMTEMGLTSISEAAFLGCNIPLVWFVGPLLAICSRKYPALVGAMPVFELLNGLSHTGMIATTGYNPGIATSIVIFIPLGIYTMVTFFGKREGKFARSSFVLLFLVALFYTACIGGCIALASAGVLTTPAAQGLFITVCTAIAFGLWYWVGRQAKASRLQQAH